MTVNNQETFDLNGKSETIGSVVLGGSGQITTGAGTLTLGGVAAVTTTAAAIISGKLYVTAFQPVFEIAQGGAATMKLTGTVTSSSSLSESITINAGTFGTGEIIPAVPVPVPEPSTIFSCVILGIVIVLKNVKDCARFSRAVNCASPIVKLQVAVLVSLVYR